MFWERLGGRVKRTTEILLQGESHGILYEGYTKQFRECIFEEGAIKGRNERYEFRCDADLQCCGRSCCVPEEATIPLWLLVLFIILASLIALAILATLAYLLAQKLKNRPKKQRNPYQTLTENGLDKSHLQEEDRYSTPYGGDKDRDRWRDEWALLEEQRRAREELERERERERERLERERMAQERERLRRELEDLDRLKAEQMRRRGSSDSDRSSLVHTHRQTVEENFVSEVRYEREVSDDDDRDDYRRRYL